LVITSPYTWMTEFTPKENWLGGFTRKGEKQTTLQGLQQSLGDDFKQIGEAEALPFVIRETQRKFQHTFAELTVWEKKG